MVYDNTFLSVNIYYVYLYLAFYFMRWVLFSEKC